MTVLITIYIVSVFICLCTLLRYKLKILGYINLGTLLLAILLSLFSIITLITYIVIEFDRVVLYRRK